MRILVLNGSPRPEGNTKKMIAAFEEGAKLNGHQVKDDMQEVYVLLQQADMLIIASPIYYHGISGQLKCVIDRFYAAAYPGRPPHLKKAAMFLSSGDADMYDGAVFSFEGDFVGYLGLENMGVFTAHGSENSSPEKLRELREFGASLR